MRISDKITGKVFSLKRIISVFCILLICSMTYTCSFAVAAADFTGKGTKKNPYIVTTPEQLNAIRNSLDSHYKLGATIDMSSFGNFTSIGGETAPFTGSFVCDTDKNGIPIYAITNLSVNFNGSGTTKAENFTGYSEDGSMGWQVGFFGKAVGASFENIILLNANVSSNVQGLYGMNSDWTINPTKFQATGGLLAEGENVSISGCGITGKIVSSSNSTGGLVGECDSVLKKCYSYAEVICTGTWGSGGLAGSVAGAESCFYSGTFSGGVTHAGALIGQAPKDDGIVIKNCWASGTVLTESSGCFGGVDNHGGGTIKNSVEVSENCYTLAKIAGRTRAQTTKRVTNNNYITNETGGFEYGFCAADMATINEAFRGLNAWTVTDGAYPQLKGVIPVTDVSGLGKISNNNANTAEASSQTGSNASSVDTANENIEQDDTGNGNYVLKTNFKGVVASLNKTDKIWVITTASVVGLTLLCAIAAVVFAIIPKKKKHNIENVVEEAEE